MRDARLKNKTTVQPNGGEERSNLPKATRARRRYEVARGLQHSLSAQVCKAVESISPESEHEAS